MYVQVEQFEAFCDEVQRTIKITRADQDALFDRYVSVHCSHMNESFVYFVPCWCSYLVDSMIPAYMCILWAIIIVLTFRSNCCPICFEPYDALERQQVTPMPAVCGHVFCYGCGVDMLHKFRECPFCRKPFTAMRSPNPQWYTLCIFIDREKRLIYLLVNIILWDGRVDDHMYCTVCMVDWVSLFWIYNSLVFPQHTSHHMYRFLAKYRKYRRILCSSFQYNVTFSTELVKTMQISNVKHHIQ